MSVQWGIMERGARPQGRRMKRLKEWMPSRSAVVDGLRTAWTVLSMSVRDMATDNGPHWAAAIAYYGLLSVFPLLLALVSLAAYFVDPARAVEQAVDLLGRFLPEGRDEVAKTVRGVLDERGTAGLLSTLLLLWTGSRAFAVLTTALNIACDADEPYGLIERARLQVGMLLTVGLLFFLALFSNLALGIIRQALGWVPALQDPAIHLLTLVVPGVILLLALFLVYRYVPRIRLSRSASLAGSATATLLFLAAQPLFVAYLQRFARYNLVYGSLSIVIAMLVWGWVVSLVVLFGGEIASHVQMLVVDGLSPEEVEARHSARAPSRSCLPGETRQKDPS